MTLNLEQIETDLAAGRTDQRTVRQLIEEVKRLRRFEVPEGGRAEVDRLSSPKPGPSTSSGHGFLAWVMQVEDALPPGMARGVNVEELQRWFEAGMTAEGAAEAVRGEGP